MSINFGTAYIDVQARVDQAERRLQQLEQRSNNAAKAVESHWNTAFKMIGSLAASGAILAIGKNIMKTAIDAKEADDLFSVSMGSIKGHMSAAEKDARRWSEQMSKSLGVSQYETRKTMGNFMVLFRGMGIGSKEAANMSKRMTELANDMSSFYNITPEEASRKLKAGLVGETEALRDLGIVINETTTKEYAYQKGITKTGQDLTETEKVVARYRQAIEKTALAHGNLKMTGGEAAGQLRRLQARWEEFSVKLGKTLIPILNKILSILIRLLELFQQLPDPVEQAVGAFGGLAAAIALAAAPLISLVTNIKMLKALRMGKIGPVTITTEAAEGAGKAGGASKPARAASAVKKLFTSVKGGSTEPVRKGSEITYGAGLRMPGERNINRYYNSALKELRQHNENISRARIRAGSDAEMFNYMQNEIYRITGANLRNIPKTFTPQQHSAWLDSFIQNGQFVPRSKSQIWKAEFLRGVKAIPGDVKGFIPKQLDYIKGGSGLLRKLGRVGKVGGRTLGIAGEAMSVYDLASSWRNASRGKNSIWRSGGWRADDGSFLGSISEDFSTMGQAAAATRIPLIGQVGAPFIWGGTALGIAGRHAYGTWANADQRRRMRDFMKEKYKGGTIGSFVKEQAAERAKSPYGAMISTLRKKFGVQNLSELQQKIDEAEPAARKKMIEERSKLMKEYLEASKLYREKKEEQKKENALIKAGKRPAWYTKLSEEEQKIAEKRADQHTAAVESSFNTLKIQAESLSWKTDAEKARETLGYDARQEKWMLRQETAKADYHTSYGNLTPEDKAKVEQKIANEILEIDKRTAAQQKAIDREIWAEKDRLVNDRLRRQAEVHADYYRAIGFYYQADLVDNQARYQTERHELDLLNAKYQEQINNLVRIARAKGLTKDQQDDLDNLRNKQKEIGENKKIIDQQKQINDYIAWQRDQQRQYQENEQNIKRIQNSEDDLYNARQENIRGYQQTGVLGLRIGNKPFTADERAAKFEYENRIEEIARRDEKLQQQKEERERELGQMDKEQAERAKRLGYNDQTPEEVLKRNAIKTEIANITRQIGLNGGLASAAKAQLDYSLKEIAKQKAEAQGGPLKDALVNMTRIRGINLYGDTERGREKADRDARLKELDIQREEELRKLNGLEYDDATKKQLQEAITWKYDQSKWDVMQEDNRRMQSRVGFTTGDDAWRTAVTAGWKQGFENPLQIQRAQLDKLDEIVKKLDALNKVNDDQLIQLTGGVPTVLTD